MYLSIPRKIVLKFFLARAFSRPINLCRTRIAAPRIIPQVMTKYTKWNSIRQQPSSFLNKLHRCRRLSAEQPVEFRVPSTRNAVSVAHQYPRDSMTEEIWKTTDVSVGLCCTSVISTCKTSNRNERERFGKRLMLHLDYVAHQSFQHAGGLRIGMEGCPAVLQLATNDASVRQCCALEKTPYELSGVAKLFS